MSVLSRNIRKLRKRKELTQEEFAIEIGASASSVLNWEKDKNEPTIFNCEVMADFFGVTLDELCRGDIE
jgi:transcriptional regulator with XRE-family HTH domain